MRRELIDVPMIHSPEAQALGGVQSPGWSMEIASEHKAAVWNTIRAGLEKRQFGQVRIYFDGYHGERIVIPRARELYTNSGANHLPFPVQMIVPESEVIKTVCKNSNTVILERTEDKKLVDAQERAIKWLGTSFDRLIRVSQEFPQDAEVPDDLWFPLVTDIANYDTEVNRASALRDDFIAKQVDATLLPADQETGILFMGAAHNVTSELPGDIVVEPLDRLLTEYVKQVYEDHKRLRETVISEMLLHD